MFQTEPVQTETYSKQHPHKNPETWHIPTKQSNNRTVPQTHSRQRCICLLGTGQTLSVQSSALGQKVYILFLYTSFEVYNKNEL